MKFLSQFAARVAKPGREPAGLRHQQQPDTLSAGAGYNHHLAARDPFRPCLAVEVPDLLDLRFVGNWKVVHNAVLLHRQFAFGRGRQHVNVIRVVLRDYVASRHAIAAEVTCRPRPGRSA